MRIKNTSTVKTGWLFAVLFISVLTLSCKKTVFSEPPGPYISGDDDVNEWLEKNMRYYYLWDEDIPQSLNHSLSPIEFFNSMLNRNYDRFSRIYEKPTGSAQRAFYSESEATYDDLGFTYKLWFINNSYYAGSVLYVKKGSLAEAGGLKRGDIFRKVNGSVFTSPLHCQSLLGGFDIALDILSNPEESNETYRVFFKRTPVMNENPVVMDSVYNIGSKKAGYLVYHGFTSGKTTTTQEYDLDINKTMLKFKNAGVSEVILDLRYNPGGYESSANVLCAALVPGLRSDLVFDRKKYNKTYSIDIARYYPSDGSGLFYNYFVQSIGRESINNIGDNLNTLYVLISGNSASASELVINVLKVYMNVVLVGKTTHGKNVGSIRLYQQDNNDNPWEIAPIVVKTHNANGESDYETGFAPSEANTISENIFLYPYGDTRDPLLARALELISPTERAVRTEPVHKNFYLNAIEEYSSLNEIEPVLIVDKPELP